MRTALIVDDTKNIRLLLSKCLEGENFTVYTAASGEEALELLNTHSFDIAFIDIKMPNISGTTLLKTIIDNNYTFPVVIMTAFATIKNAVTTTQLGAKAYLQKPFTATTIRKVLCEIFPDYTLIQQINKLDSIKLKLSTSPLDPQSYNLLGDYLIEKGAIEKGLLFKKFSKELIDLNE